MLRLFLSAAALVVIPMAASAAASQRFIVTEHDTSRFVVQYTVSPPDFVISERLLPVPPSSATVVANSTKRPVVMLYSATWCVPCRIARQALERAQLPFEIRVIDVTQGGQPPYVDSIPYFEWDAPSGRRFAKWTTVADLVQRWKLTQTGVSK